MNPKLIWPTWIAASLTSFAVLEALAFRTERFPTLSRTLAGWLGVYPPNGRRDAALVLFGSAWVALTVHIATYRPRERKP